MVGNIAKKVRITVHLDIYVVIKWQLYLVTHVRQHLARPLCFTDSSTLNGNFFWNLDGRISLKTKMDLFSSCNIFVVGCRACNLLLCTIHKRRWVQCTSIICVFVGIVCYNCIIYNIIVMQIWWKHFDEYLLNFVFL